jgi:PAS domain S-box-containing protein
LGKILASATLGILTLVILARTSALTLLLSANYLPHRCCYLAQPGMIWTNVVTDGLIAVSYVLIFACLFWVAGRLRKIPEVQSYLWVFVSFAIFIVACASTHVMEVVTVWWPVYRISIVFKVVCAAASVGTAALFTKAAPGITTGIRQFLDTLASSQGEHAADVLEHVRVRGQVRETEARMQAILDSVVDSIITIDATGIIISINPAVVKMFEYPAEELLGKNVKMLMPEPDHSSHDGHLARYQSTGKTTVIGVGRKLQGLTKTGRAFPMELTITEVALAGERLVVGLIRDLSEHDAAGEELRKRVSLLDLALDAIFVRDLHNRVIYWNRGAENMYGWSAAEAMGQLSHQLLQTKFPVPMTTIEAAFASQGNWEGELRHKTRQGNDVVVTSRWALQCDAQGLPAAILEINRDITDSKRGEEVRERLAAIVRSSDDAIISKTPEGTITAWNRGAERLFGYSESEAVGQPMAMLLPEEQVDEEVEILARIARGESVEHFETVRVRKDGAKIDVSVTISPIRDGNSRIIGASKVARDITERKRAAEELMRSRDALETQALMLQSVLNSMAEGLVAADQGGRFILWNPAADKIIGTSTANLQAAQWGARYGAYLPDKVTPFPNEQNPLLRAIAGEVSRAEIFFYNSQLGRGVWIECNGSPLRDGDGSVHGGVAAFSDITQRKADELEIQRLNEDLEERIAERTGQLQAANHELEAFSYSVSHDLRAPLRHIAGFARILISDFGPGMTPEARDHLQRIDDAVIRMGLLVDGLLGLAKLGRQSLQLRQTELNTIVDQAIGILQPECEGRAVEWRIAGLPALQCDPILLGQVFQNLLGNALKYSRGRSRAVIEVDSIQEAGKPPVIFVRDNGAGFNMEYAEKLFGVFQRMHTESEFEGTGVGLATVQRIIQKHGGSVWAEAEADRGATFFFSLGDHERARFAVSHWP